MALTCGWFLWCGDYGGRLEADWNGGLCQGEAKDHGEETRKLVGKGFEGPAAFLVFTLLSTCVTSALVQSVVWNQAQGRAGLV